MKHLYMKQVKRNLKLPRKAKLEVLRDLDEAFASAHEHGETDQQVIVRLGTPEEFSESVQEQFRSACAGKCKWKKQAGIAAAFFISVIAFATACLIHLSRPAENMIGQADAATAIQISGNGKDLFALMLLLGCMTFFAAMGLILHEIHQKRKRKTI